MTGSRPDGDTVGARLSSLRITLVDPIVEDNPGSMVDLNLSQPGDSIESSNPGSSPITEGHVDSPLAIPKISIPKSLETPVSQGLDKGVPASAEIPSPTMDTSLPGLDKGVPASA
ncbi:hypothetical protein RHGRI_030715 [Rhododendron griersonianum]|uniref:Uncharacterized protein n=1 Tax=Rhododendron griersonianum TaxID=479676 RepID=A0AAV6I8A6_9ERIC|nr:hypothetical protein RHGRI_030715 [Rhododendron griersonianum]